MLKTHISACLLTTALLAAPALAQTSTTTSPAPAAPAGSTMSPGATTNISPNANTNTSAGGAAMMNTGEFITKREPGMISASELIGMDVRGANNEDIGEVGDVLLDRSGQARAVVIDVGGFLGLGETHVAIPMQSVQFRSKAQRDTTATGSVGTAGTPAPAGTTANQSQMNQNQANMASGANDARPDAIILVMSKDQLKSAPKFEENDRASNTGGTTGSTMGGSSGTTTTAPKQ